MTQAARKPANDDVVQLRHRVDASHALAKLVDRTARRLSRYGDPGATHNLDEPMVLNGLGFLLGHWWRDLPDADVELRIRGLMKTILESRRELLGEKSKKVN